MQIKGDLGWMMRSSSRRSTTTTMPQKENISRYNLICMSRSQQQPPLQYRSRAQNLLLASFSCLGDNSNDDDHDEDATKRSMPIVRDIPSEFIIHLHTTKYWQPLILGLDLIPGIIHKCAAKNERS